jgi:hypothetical protein
MYYVINFWRSVGERLKKKKIKTRKEKGGRLGQDEHELTYGWMDMRH